jgi:hypothetical protein
MALNISTVDSTPIPADEAVGRIIDRTLDPVIREAAADRLLDILLIASRDDFKRILYASNLETIYEVELDNRYPVVKQTIEMIRRLVETKSGANHPDENLNHNNRISLPTSTPTTHPYGSDLDRLNKLIAPLPLNPINAVGLPPIWEFRIRARKFKTEDHTFTTLGGDTPHALLTVENANAHCVMELLRTQKISFMLLDTNSKSRIRIDHTEFRKLVEEDCVLATVPRAKNPILQSTITNII